MHNRHTYKILILVALIITGIVLQLAGFFNPQELVPLARQYADHWWLMLLLVLVQVG